MRRSYDTVTAEICTPDDNLTLIVEGWIEGEDRSVGMFGDSIVDITVIATRNGNAKPVALSTPKLLAETEWKDLANDAALELYEAKKDCDE